MPNSRIKSGVISEPPPTPVRPTSGAYTKTRQGREPIERRHAAPPLSRDGLSGIFSRLFRAEVELAKQVSTRSDEFYRAAVARSRQRHRENLADTVAAARHDDDLVGKIDRFLDVVRHHDHRDLLLLPEAFELALHAHADGAVPEPLIPELEEESSPLRLGRQSAHFLTEQRDEALSDLQSWVTSGKLKVQEDVINGLENTPKALIGLLAGENRGKRMVRV